MVISQPPDSSHAVFVSNLQKEILTGLLPIERPVISLPNSYLQLAFWFNFTDMTNSTEEAK